MVATITIEWRLVSVFFFAGASILIIMALPSIVLTIFELLYALKCDFELEWI